MVGNSNMQNIIDRFYAEAQEDAIGLWEIIDEIEENSNSNIDIRQQTSLLVRLLLARGLIAGNPPYSATGYEPWPNQEPDAVVNRINREWDALGRLPSVPDIVWFALPSTSSG